MAIPSDIFRRPGYDYDRQEYENELNNRYARMALANQNMFGPQNGLGGRIADAQQNQPATSASPIFPNGASKLLLL